MLLKPCKATSALVLELRRIVPFAQGHQVRLSLRIPWTSGKVCIHVEHRYQGWQADTHALATSQRLLSLSVCLGAG